MAYSLTWLKPVLEAAGLKVAETDGWRDRACRPGDKGEMAGVIGVICHHTATVAEGNMPSLGTLIKGRADVPGPLAQLGLGRDGAFHLIAAGRCNHAGVGEGQYATVSGNGRFIGIEAENPRPYTAQWPAVQLDAYHRGAAAILAHLGASVDKCIAHKEYAPSRKPVDPALDMVAFRQAVQAIMGGGAVRPPIAAADPHGRPTLRRGASGDAVALCQAKLGVKATRAFDAATEAAARAFQRAHGLVADGIVGPATWAVLAR